MGGEAERDLGLQRVVAVGADPAGVPLGKLEEGGELKALQSRRNETAIPLQWLQSRFGGVEASSRRVGSPKRCNCAAITTPLDGNGCNHAGQGCNKRERHLREPQFHRPSRRPFPRSFRRSFCCLFRRSFHRFFHCLFPRSFPRPTICVHGADGGAVPGPRGPSGQKVRPARLADRALCVQPPDRLTTGQIV